MSENDERHHLLQQSAGPDAPRQDQFKPTIVSGREFFGRLSVSLESSVARTGVTRVASIDDLLGDFWPENESIDELHTTLRDWRSEGETR